MKDVIFYLGALAFVFSYCVIKEHLLWGMTLFGFGLFDLILVKFIK